MRLSKSLSTVSKRKPSHTKFHERKSQAGKARGVRQVDRLEKHVALLVQNYQWDSAHQKADSRAIARRIIEVITDLTSVSAKPRKRASRND